MFIKENLFGHFSIRIGIPWGLPQTFYIRSGIKIKPDVCAAAMSLSSVQVGNAAFKMVKTWKIFIRKWTDNMNRRVRSVKTELSSLEIKRITERGKQWKTTLSIEGMMRDTARQLSKGFKRSTGVSEVGKFRGQKCSCYRRWISQRRYIKNAVVDAGYEVTDIQ